MATPNPNGRNANQIKNRKDTIKAMYQDCIRGKQKWEIKEKWLDGKYKNNARGEQTFGEYWREMLERFKDEFEKNREDLKSKFLARYMSLYEKAVDKGNIKEARQILDSITKLTGADEPVKQEINLSGDFVIDFGLDNIVKDAEGNVGNKPDEQSEGIV